MTRSYRRVPSNEANQAAAAAAGGSGVPPSPTSGNSQAPSEVSVASNNVATQRAHNRSLSERVQDKVIALAWVITAWMVSWFSKTWGVLRHPVQAGANPSLLQIVALLLGINTVLMMYLTVYLPKFKGLTDSSAWEVYCPAVIPTMTGLGILAFILAIRALWPVWGFLAPLILSIQCLGLLFFLHFVPY